ncbi:cyanophycin synthetase [Flavobacterium wongokense]|uniref:cyanophycin synthetase n=1 Tax=Flavobacterium wongokense TaxID=2910674 RepID=UPI001F2EE9E2|nr:cyanophycin synthetase [Flavobacterium sp. WG47]MCF6132324.1 cyanophycin synthetase [Flavobacterium sp. WG47]
MKILKKQVLRGPNVWSNYRNRLIQVRLDLEEMEDFPTDKIDGFLERFKAVFPQMVSHECSEGKEGGFFERLRRGTWLGHVMEHVALEIQSMAGMECGFGRTKGTNIRGVYNMMFCYEVEEAGLYAAESAFRMVEAIAKNEPYDFEKDIEELKILARRHGLGPSTKSIVKEAQRRGIPWMRLGTNSKIQLGFGSAQKRFQATMTCNTSDAAVRLAGNKHAAKELLATHCIPVAKGDSCSTVEGLKEIVDTIGFPLVIKPIDGNQGRGATINIPDYEAAVTAFEYAKQISNYVIVERFVAGSDYRLLVIDGKLIAAAKRIPAMVTGDGVRTIDELIHEVNSESRRGDGHESSLTKIHFDQDTFTQLEKYDYTIASIPKKGEIIYLKSTANLSTGGTAEDVTDNVHPENKFLAERVAKIIGLDICGIDIMAESIEEPLRENGGVVLEVNAAPGFRMHLDPSVGKSRNVASAVVDMLYPQGTQPTIPLFAVTGTNGKTTTTRLLAHMAKSAGYVPGYTTTDGIYINGYKIKSGDCSGPSSGTLVLQDPTVDFAVLETARGGLLRSGLCFDHCDVGIITNIAEDHLGLNDIHTLEDLTNVKGVIARSVRKNGWAVLNAEDDNCLKIADTLDCNIAYFALDPTDDRVHHLINTDALVATVEGNHITIIYEGEKYRIEDVTNIPLAEGGKARFMVANILAASVAAFAWGISVDHIREALLTFIPGHEMTPGRMNLFEFKNYKVLVDYAHNPHGFLALKEYLDNFHPKRKIGIIAGIGDRRDEDTIELARIAATMFDHIIVRQEHSLRGKTVDEINALVVKGIQSAGPKVTYDLVPEETEAIVHAFKILKKGDLLVALSDGYDAVIKVIQQELDKESVIALPNDTHVEAV